MRSDWMKRAALAAALATGGCGDRSPTGPEGGECEPLEELVGECGTEDGAGCAPDSLRVDLCVAPFSDPAAVTNPLFPIRELHSVVLLGNADGEKLRVEVTLLPGTKTIGWNDQEVETLESQYVAFLDGRLEEVALDWYAQADDGSVWYFGEDVFNYADGELADTEGTWIAGEESPAAMIMPADPRVGDVYRPENTPDVVFEEVRVIATGLMVDGPSGAVAGAIQVDELHMDGTHEDKTFAPGYGEFVTGSAGGGLEGVALAVPVDALGGFLPASLEAMLEGAWQAYDAAAAADWSAAQGAHDAVEAAWADYAAGGVPAMLGEQFDDALAELAAGIAGADPTGAGLAAIAVARAAADFHLRYEAPVEIDLIRFELWAAQVPVDAAAADAGGVRGDVTTLEWVRDRIAHALAAGDLAELDGLLEELRGAADAADFTAAASAAAELRALLAEIGAAP